MTLIVVIGLPGTGKTVLANELSSFLPNNPVNLSTDLIRRNVFNFSQHQYAKFGEKHYSSQNRQLVYNVLRLIVEILIKQQLSVIVDGTFYSQATREPFYEVCDRFNCNLVVINTICSEETVKNRILGRKTKGKNISDADFEIHLEMKKRFEPIKNNHLIVNTERDLLNNLKKVGIYIENL